MTVMNMVGNKNAENTANHSAVSNNYYKIFTAMFYLFLYSISCKCCNPLQCQRKELQTRDTTEETSTANRRQLLFPCSFAYSDIDFYYRAFL